MGRLCGGREGNGCVVADARKIVAVLGPTASGKTALAIGLAARFGGEIVSADSRLVYRGMDIGTAKPTAAERARVPHHLIDVTTPDAQWDVTRWTAAARATIADIAARGRLPLVVGGTAQYTVALLDGWEPPAVPPDPNYRAALEARAATEGVSALLAELAAVDAEAAERTGPNLRRIIRALEVIRATGQPFSAQRGRGPKPYDDLRLALTLPRDLLYARIDARAGAMVAAGLVDEVRGLFAAGYDRALPAMSGIGYAQIAAYLAGERTLDEAKADIRHATHRYARHQLTWLRRDPAAIVLDATDPARALAEATERVAIFFATMEGERNRGEESA